MTYLFAHVYGCGGLCVHECRCIRNRKHWIPCCCCLPWLLGLGSPGRSEQTLNHWAAFVGLFLVFQAGSYAVQAVPELAESYQITLPHWESTRELAPSWVTVFYPARARLGEQGQVLRQILGYYKRQQDNWPTCQKALVIDFLIFTLFLTFSFIMTARSRPCTRYCLWGGGSGHLDQGPQAQGHRTSGPLRASQLLGGVVGGRSLCAPQTSAVLSGEEWVKLSPLLSNNHWISRKVRCGSWGGRDWEKLDVWLRPLLLPFPSCISPFLALLIIVTVVTIAAVIIIGGGEKWAPVHVTDRREFSESVFFFLKKDLFTYFYVYVYTL